MSLQVVTEYGEILPVVPNLGAALRPSSTALYLPANLSEQEWRAAGIALAHTEQSISWWIGDWWAFGEKRYGARKAIVESPEWDGPSFQTCANAAAVCKAFETSRRREVLSFSHHAEVAALPPDEAR